MGLGYQALHTGKWKSVTQEAANRSQPPLAPELQEYEDLLPPQTCALPGGCSKRSVRGRLYRSETPYLTPKAAKKRPVFNPSTWNKKNVGGTIEGEKNTGRERTRFEFSDAWNCLTELFRTSLKSLKRGSSESLLIRFWRLTAQLHKHEH